MQQRLGTTAPPDRHHQGIGDKLGRHGRAHRPADHPAREQVEHRGHVEPAFCRPDIGEVRDPFAVGRGSLECAIEHVGSDGGVRPLTQISRPATPSRAGAQGPRAHQPLDAMQAA
jgi:hypothetical protein